MTEHRDPFMAYNFRVEVSSLTIGGFSEVSGLQAEIEVKEYREGGQNNYLHKLPGPVKYPNNLVLKRGLAAVDDLWSWYQEVLSGKIEARNGSIILYDAAGDERRRWNFFAAYPVRWIGPQLNASSSTIAVETLELVHHGLTTA